MASRLIFLTSSAVLLFGAHVGFCGKNNTAFVMAKKTALEAKAAWRGVVKNLSEEGLTKENFQKSKELLQEYREKVRQCPRNGKARLASLTDAERLIEQAITYKVSKDNGEESDVDPKRLRSFIGAYGEEVDQIIQKALANGELNPTSDK